MTTVPTCSSLAFFAALEWLDGEPLLNMIEPYRRRIFEQAFSVDEAGVPRYSLVLAGRGKKNAKSLDLVLAALYSLLLRDAVQGSGGYVLANDLDQAADDLDLAKKLVRRNAVLDAELLVRAKEIERKDGRGVLAILPARDVAGSHGKTAAFIGYDEIHEYRDYALLEALSPDPTRRDALTWITSYDSLSARARPAAVGPVPARQAGRGPADAVLLVLGRLLHRPRLPRSCRPSSGRTRAWRAGPTRATWRSSGFGCRPISSACCT